jgi:hypothetical protein
MLRFQTSLRKLRARGRKGGIRHMVREALQDRFLRTLTELGGQDDTDWRVQSALVDEGHIVKGRGRGGSVALADGSFSPQPSHRGRGSRKNPLPSWERVTAATHPWNYRA